MAIIWLKPSEKAPSEPIYIYDNPSVHKIAFTGIFIRQHGRIIRTVFGKVQDFDRLALTPEIGERNNAEMTTLFFQSNIPWQRRLNADRLPNIESWWKNDNSSSPNGSLIYFGGLVKISDNPSNNSFIAEFDPSDWVFESCPKCYWNPSVLDSSYLGFYSDCCPECGYCSRPGMVVDGQHRLRGMSRDPDHNGNHLELVFSTWLLGRDGFNQHNVAKIFTEVTSSAVTLPKLHQEFLSAKYELAPTYDQSLLNGRVRKRAYQIASQLNLSATKWALNTNGRVEMIDRSRALNGDIIDVQRLTEFISRWITNGPLDNSSLSDTMIIDALENFLKAALTIWNGSKYWNDDRRKNAAFQNRGVFRMLLHCFEFTSRRILNSGLNLSTRNYEMELSFIQPIKWELTGWTQVYTRQDADQNITRRILSTIFEKAPNAPIPFGKTISNQINQWMESPPDQITIESINSSISNDFIEVSFTCDFPILNGVKVKWPQNAKGKAVAIISKGGEVLNQIDFSNDLKFKISETISNKLNPGEKLEIEILFRSWSLAPTVKKIDIILGV